MSFTIPSFAWPMKIVTGENDTLIVNELDGAPDVSVVIPQGTYFWRNDGTANDMRVVFNTALNAACIQTFTTVLGPAIIAGTALGRLTVATAGGDFQLEWDNGLTTLEPSWFGFLAATYVATNPSLWVVQSPNYIGRSWFPEQEYVDELYMQGEYEGSQQIMSAGSIDTQLYGERYDKSILLDVLPLNKCWQEFETYTQEAFLSQDRTSQRPSDWIAAGERFEFCPDYQNRSNVTTNPDVRDTYKPIGTEFINKQKFVAPSGVVNRFNIWIPMSEYVE